MVTINTEFDQERDFRPSDVDQRVALAITWRSYDLDLHQEMLNVLASSARNFLPELPQTEIRGGAYHVGPMAQGATVQMLFTVYETVRPIAEDIGIWVAVGAFARDAILATRRVLRRRIVATGSEVDPVNYPGAYLDSEIVVSQPLVRGLCSEHFFHTYGAAKQRVSMDVKSRSLYPGIVWAGRPDRSIIYTVRIWTGKTSYVYVVGGDSRPIEHFRIRGSELVQLPLPEWYEDAAYLLHPELKPDSRHPDL